MEKRTTDTMLADLKKLVEAKIPVARELWLEAAFDLSILRMDEAKLFNKMCQSVAKKKLEILKSQEKKNVALAEVEIESSDEYCFMKDQEDKLYSIDELVRVAKKSADLNL